VFGMGTGVPSTTKSLTIVISVGIYRPFTYTPLSRLDYYITVF